MTFRRDDRRDFSRKVKLVAFAKAKGHCDGCTAPLCVGHFVYDHIVPWALGRDSSIANCQVLCDACNTIKTGTLDVPVIAKSNRQRDRHIGAKGKSRTPLPCGRDSWAQKKVGGKVVRRASGLDKHRALMAKRRIGP